MSGRSAASCTKCSQDSRRFVVQPSPIRWRRSSSAILTGKRCRAARPRASASCCGGVVVNGTGDFGGGDRYPSWSPGGRQVAFWSERDGGGYYVMPALGGAPTKLIPTIGEENFYSAPEWSADGTQLAAATYTTAA